MNFQDSKKNLEISEEFARFYELPEGQELHEITGDLLKSPLVKEVHKEAILRHGRKIFVFHYPSDGFKVKGAISFTPNSANHPLLYNLRGGNRWIGIPSPASDLMCYKDYPSISTLYRGGVSEGVDEFGGKDVKDVKNLWDFLPNLESKLSIKIQTKKNYLISSSRGGMQMFLFLTRFPDYQSAFDKIVSLSGLLDLREMLKTRDDMEEMFIRDFGLIKGVNEEKWLNGRDPILMVDKIRSDLPILLIQGTDDERLNLKQGYNMIQTLKDQKKTVEYWEFKGGDHCIRNVQNRMTLIMEWIEGVPQSLRTMHPNQSVG